MTYTFRQNQIFQFPLLKLWIYYQQEHIQNFLIYLKSLLKRDPMFQTQEKPISMIKTCELIEIIQDKEKNAQVKRFETQKLNNLLSIELDPKRQWTLEQENLLFELHNRHGNKWAIIAQNFKERSDNSVKNHFYSRLRKGLRKINKIINYELKKTFKQYKIIDLYKVIQSSDQKFKEIKTEQYEFADVGVDLKNRIFLFAEQNYDSTEETKARVRELIIDLSNFTKDYKRKSKKNRRYSPLGIDSVYRAHIKGLSGNIQSNQKSNIIRQHYEIQNSQQPNKSMVELQKTSLINCRKSLDQKNEKKKQLNQQKKGLKKSEQIVDSLRTNKKKSYTHFSEDQEELKNDSQELREQRLNNFAQNILKTFKSYISFESFNSNGLGEELFP